MSARQAHQYRDAYVHRIGRTLESACLPSIRKALTCDEAVGAKAQLSNKFLLFTTNSIRQQAMVFRPAQEPKRVPLRDALEGERTLWRNGAFIRCDCQSVYCGRRREAKDLRPREQALNSR